MSFIDGMFVIVRWPGETILTTPSFGRPRGGPRFVTDTKVEGPANFKSVGQLLVWTFLVKDVSGTCAAVGVAPCPSSSLRVSLSSLLSCSEFEQGARKRVERRSCSPDSSLLVVLAFERARGRGRGVPRGEATSIVEVPFLVFTIVT